ncbi:MAG: sugar ABC transporter substrate-binding protein [Chloroflexi bacterium]|nr:sugar ABC transporter substrate-binding protein [Chloroflexota bacterium]
MKALKVLVLVAIIVAIALPMSVAAQDDPTEVTLWYHSGREGERTALDDIIDSFNESQGEWVITRTEIPEGSYNDNVKAASVAGELPCVLDFDGPFIMNYVYSGDLIPLDEYASDELLSDVLPSIIAQGTYTDGMLYSFGQFDSGLGLWGNRAMLEEAGVRIPEGLEDTWTYDEFSAALDALAAVVPEDGYVIDLKMNYTGEWSAYAFAPWLMSFGGEVINRDGYDTADGYLNGPEAVEAFTFLQNLFLDGYTTDSPVDPDADFMEGRVPLSYCGHWCYNNYKDALGDDLVLIPQPDFGYGAVTGMGSWNWGITSTCEVPDGAWAFIEYAMGPDNIILMTEENGAVPARVSLLEADERYAEGGDLHIYFRQLNEGVAIPRAATVVYPTISSQMETIMRAIANGEDVRTTLDEAVAEIDTAIASFE